MERHLAPRGRRPAATGSPDPRDARGSRPTPPGEIRTRLIALAAAYGDRTLGWPSPFFADPVMPEVKLAPLGDGPLDTQVVDLRYASDYEPFLPAARDVYLRGKENLTAHVRWWTSGRGRPTIVMVHGWGGGNQWVTQRTFAVPYWLRHGYDVASFVLPFHGARAANAMRSGAGFPSANPLRTNESFGQAIHDLRGLSVFLRDRGASAVGALGMSLGGYTIALWASVAGPAEPGGLDFAVAMIPAVSMGRLMWRLGEHTPARARAIKDGVTEDLMIEICSVHAPTTRPARLPRERLFVIGGRGDRITPPEQAEQLAAHWGVDVRWFDGGHLAQLGRGDTFRDVRRELGAVGWPGREFRGPRR